MRARLWTSTPGAKDPEGAPGQAMASGGSRGPGQGVLVVLDQPELGVPLGHW